jgi:manganese transport protein
VAAVAYVDPGNVAANMTSGATYGFLLVWVLVLSNAMAVIVQYQSAKLGIVTGLTLPEHVAASNGHGKRIAYWIQAELVIMATDIAEVIGGAVALHLLFGLPLWLGGLIVGGMSLAILGLQAKGSQRPFESAIIGLLGVVALGFLAGLVVNPPHPGDVLGGLVPRFEGPGSVLIAASMLGATVMPHGIYVHSALAIKRHGSASADDEGSPLRTARLLRATRLDVVVALTIAGAVNIGMLLVAAVNLQGRSGTDTLEGAHAAMGDVFGPVIALVFAVGLLASGLASTTVGAYAGDVVMRGLLHRHLEPWVRRAVSLAPAMAVLLSGMDPTSALILSQVILSFGIPCALIPLARRTRSRAIMGEFADVRALQWASGASVAVIVVLNVVLIVLTVLHGG